MISNHSYVYFLYLYRIFEDSREGREKRVREKRERERERERRRLNDNQLNKDCKKHDALALHRTHYKTYYRTHYSLL